MLALFQLGQCPVSVACIAMALFMFLVLIAYLCSFTLTYQRDLPVSPMQHHFVARTARDPINNTYNLVAI